MVSWIFGKLTAKGNPYGRSAGGDGDLLGRGDGDGADASSEEGDGSSETHFG